jgi:hypothetical protein
MYNSSGMSPQEFGGIMQAAKQSNVPIGLALRANMHGAHLRRSYDGKGEQYAKAYAEMRMGVGASDNTKLLGAIYSENPDMVRRVLESGNQNALNQMLEGARRSGKMLYNRRTVDMPNFLDKLSTMSPQAFDMLQKYEVKQYADRYQLGGLLKNKQFLADYIADPSGRPSQILADGLSAL